MEIEIETATQQHVQCNVLWRRLGGLRQFLQRCQCVEVDTAYDYKVWANVGTELATRERTWRKNLSMRCSQLL